MLANISDVTGTTDAIGPSAGEARVLRFEIRANAFCHQMVRSIVGALVDVGLGRMHAGEMRSLMLGRDRQAAPEIAPARGLVLWEVGYPETVVSDQRLR